MRILVGIAGILPLAMAWTAPAAAQVRNDGSQSVACFAEYGGIGILTDKARDYAFFYLLHPDNDRIGLVSRETGELLDLRQGKRRTLADGAIELDELEMIGENKQTVRIAPDRRTFEIDVWQGDSTSTPFGVVRGTCGVFDTQFDLEGAEAAIAREDRRTVAAREKRERAFLTAADKRIDALMDVFGACLARELAETKVSRTDTPDTVYKRFSWTCSSKYRQWEAAIAQLPGALQAEAKQRVETRTTAARTTTLAKAAERIRQAGSAP